MIRSIKSIMLRTQKIMENHERLQRLNHERVKYVHCKDKHFHEVNEFEFRGKKITIEQVVNEFNGYCKYAICYHEDDKLIGHNIRYVDKLYHSSRREYEWAQYRKEWNASRKRGVGGFQIPPMYRLQFTHRVGV